MAASTIWVHGAWPSAWVVRLASTTPRAPTSLASRDLARDGILDTYNSIIENARPRGAAGRLCGCALSSDDCGLTSESSVCTVESVDCTELYPVCHLPRDEYLMAVGAAWHQSAKTKPKAHTCVTATAHPHANRNITVAAPATPPHHPPPPRAGLLSGLWGAADPPTYRASAPHSQPPLAGAPTSPRRRERGPTAPGTSRLPRRVRSQAGVSCNGRTGAFA